MDDQRLQTLLHHYLDQALTDPEKAELEQALLSSSKARDAFWKLAHFDSSLRHWGETEWGIREAQAAQRKPARKFPTALAVWTAGLAAAAVLAVQFWPADSPVVSPPYDDSSLATLISTAAPATTPAATSKEIRGVAVLRRAVGATWIGQNGPPQAGEVIPAGLVRLSKGIIQLEMTRGARVVFEGPGELELFSENRVFLRSGKARVQVPEPARDFQLLTSTATVTDLGTEFGCLVGPSGSTEIHVLSGAVAVTPSGSQERISLEASTALEILPGNRRTSIPCRPSDFILDEELARRDTALSDLRLVAWREARSILSSRPSALLHFDFEGARGLNRYLPNLAAKTASSSIIGCDPTEGRWPGKGALEFKRLDDSIRTKIPGEFEALTFFAWVRADSIPNRQFSLIMPDGFAKGIVHWFINRNGNLAVGQHLGNDGDPNGWRYVQSIPVIRSGSLGTWIFVATTLDSSTGKVHHYLNGKAIPNLENKYYFKGPFRFGNCDVGNWSFRPEDPRWAGIQLRTPNDHIRHFQGRMDEFAIFSEALDAETINSIYEVGRPGDTTVTVLPSTRDPNGTVVR